MLLKKFARVSRPLWAKGEWKASGSLFLGAIVLTLLLVGVQYWLTTWQQDFYDSIEKKDIETFWSSIVTLSGIVVLFVFVTFTQFYASEKLKLRWRDKLTMHMQGLWLDKGNHYYWQHIEEKSDNPDQRIEQDCDEFVKGMLMIGIDAFRELITLAAFFTMLWGLSKGFTVFGVEIPGMLVWAAFLFSAVSTLISHLLGHRIAPLNFKQQKLEADYRYSLMRIRENSESIVLSKSEKTEDRFLTGQFSHVIHNAMRLVMARSRLTGFNTFYGVAATVFPILLSTPRLFAGQITFGQVFQTATAFENVNGALSFFARVYGSLAEWVSTLNRLDQFLIAIDQAEAKRSEVASRICRDEAIEIKDLQILFPQASIQGQLDPINFHLKAGDSLMIQGPSGVGKSTLLRVMAGIWPHFEGSVTAPLPERSHMISQKFFLPIGTLREVLTYPEVPESIEDGLLLSTMVFCGLEKFVDRLDESAHWTQVLSPGELQKVAWTKMFLKQPDVIYLDEATAALDEELQDRLYAEIPRKLPQAVVISIAHRSELAKFHTQTLILDTPSLPKLEIAG